MGIQLGRLNGPNQMLGPLPIRQLHRGFSEFPAVEVAFDGDVPTDLAGVAVEVSQYVKADVWALVSSPPSLVVATGPNSTIVKLGVQAERLRVVTDETFVGDTNVVVMTGTTGV